MFVALWRFSHCGEQASKIEQILCHGHNKPHLNTLLFNVTGYKFVPLKRLFKSIENKKKKRAEQVMV